MSQFKREGGKLLKFEGAEEDKREGALPRMGKGNNEKQKELGHSVNVYAPTTLVQKT